MVGRWVERASTFGPTSATVGLVALVASFAVAVVGSIVLFELRESGWVFLALFCGLFVLLGRLESTWEVVGAGCYLSAAFVLLYPLVVLVALLVAPADPDGGGLWMADVIYTLVVRWPAAVVLSLPFVGAGYLFHRRARRRTDGAAARRDE